MTRTLHARPHLEHFKKQAKKLQAERGPGCRLSEAQLLVARSAGFDSWPKLARHVEVLRALEGTWTFVGLEVDGAPVPAALSAASRILMDGDRFRLESPEANYDGVFTIDVEAAPHAIDIAFVEGPEAGNTALGIFELDADRLTICLGLVGSTRPGAFKTAKGSGHALERLRRASAARPASVTGGTASATTPAPGPAIVDAKVFELPPTPFMKALEGEWTPTALVRNGEPMNAEWLAFGSRTQNGRELKVVFGGQTMVHAKVSVDEAASPMAIDYLGLSGAAKGRISLGILDWNGRELRVNMAAPGAPRPADFNCVRGSGRTLSQWRRRGPD